MSRAAVKDRSEPDAAPETPDLGALPGYLGYALRRAQTALFRDFAGRSAALDITPGQFSLLAIVAANPGISQVALAKLHGLDKSTLSPAVDKLAKRGLLQRRRAAGDRRFHALSLTQEGEAMLGRVTAAIEDQEAAMAAALTPAEHKTLIALLHRLAAVLNGGG